MNRLSSKEIDDAMRLHIVDVREPDEYHREHIPGSCNMPLGNIADHAAELADRPVIVSCQSGVRAEEAGKILLSCGCQDVSLLEGGLRDWKRAGLPTLSQRAGLSVMRQTQILVGCLTILASFYKPLWFLAPMAGLGLLVAGLTNTCLMASLLSKMPWNR